MIIFVKLDRLSSVRRLRRRFFINVVEMGLDKHMVASVCRLGNNAISIPLVSNSFSCMDISSFGYLIRSCRYVFHSVLRSEEAMAAFLNSVPSNDLACKPLPSCPMRI